MGEPLEKADKPTLVPLHAKALSDDEFSIYEDEFDVVFSDELCRNIALSGPYGAGKSSVISKAQGNRPEMEWLTVSLANFGEKDSVDGGPNEAEIEAEVLRQIVHKVDLREAPKSRLRKVHDYGWEKDYVLGFYLVAFLAVSCTILPFFPNLMNGEQPSALACVLMLLWVLMAWWGVYSLLRRNMFARFVKSLKFMNAELEIGKEEEKSPYERCVDEIVYVLNASKVDVVVFEDLDRFNSLSIFQKMRNLNRLANDSRDEREPLRFFYLMRDGLFEEPRDRTKFFDYVIPVIPYVDPSNALDKFKAALRGVGISADEGFLFQLSSFIDDPRIIHDIADEAFHYKKALFGERSFGEGDPERLIALLVYKAMFPADFENLQTGRGYLYEVLNGRDRLAFELEDWTDEEITSINNELQSIDARLSATEDELIVMYLAPRLSDVMPHNNAEYKSCKNPQETLVYLRANCNHKLEQELERLEGNNEFNERMQEARQVSDRKSAVLRARLKDIEDRRALIQSMSIKQLIDESPSADCLFKVEENKIKRPQDYKECEMEKIQADHAYPLVRLLVSGGWIDESYRRYISNFYGKSLCASDDDFLSLIQQSKSVDMAYEPKDPGVSIWGRRQGRYSE